MRPALAVLTGALLLAWPAWLNGYPILFSDTGAFLHQTQGPLMIWDKPWIYGPMLAAMHAGVTLWGPVLGQGLALSWLLWLVQRAVRGLASPRRHLLLVTALAALTAAPWFVSLLMPDIFAPMTVLALFLLAVGPLTTVERLVVLLLATLGIAAHLAHLPLAGALVLLLAVRQRSGWPALPLALAVLLLLLTNLAGHGRLALSPYGATFLLARLQADGPAARTLQARCPAAGWTLCPATARLPMDSDAFLWEPDSPLNRDAEGHPRAFGGMVLAAEARAILAETLRREPLGVAGAMLANTGRQLLRVQVGDTLGREHLGVALGPRLGGFPAAEQQRFASGLQANGLLPAAAAPFLLPHAVVLLLGALGSLLALRRSLMQRDAARVTLLLCVMLGLAANAFATGALSGPHDRYQARIAWLLPLAAVLCWRPPAPGRPMRYG